MAHARHALLAALTVFSGCATPDDPTDAVGDALTVSGTPVFCRPMTAATGTLSTEQRADALDRPELTGTKDDWRRYVELSRNTQLVCRFTLPAGSRSAPLTLTTNYRGPTRAEMKVPFEAFDPAAQRWVTVGDNAFARDWRWTRSAMNLPQGLADEGGAVQLRVSTGAADVADLDELVVWVQGADAGTSVPPPPVDAGTTSTPTPADAGATPPPPPPPPPADAGTTPPAPGTWWKPTATAPIHWHWQLSTDFVVPRDVKPNVTVYDIDGERTSAATVAALHALGPNVKVICYFDAGVFENYRSDASRFPASIIGKQDIGWPGSYWLDIRRLDLLMPILKDRMQHWCKDKGFDAIEPDETEVWSNPSGFPITKADNVAFHQAISAAAHAMGLSVGLKGNNTEAVELEPLYDWALSEQCFQYGECTFFRDGFVARNKAVFTVEYDVSPNCTQANTWHLNSSRRDLDLVGPTQSGYLYQPCVPDSRDTW